MLHFFSPKRSLTAGPLFGEHYTNLDIYCVIPVGATTGGQKYVQKGTETYMAVSSDVVPFKGLNIGAIPGIALRFGKSWSIFAELGFRYHFVVPSKLEVGTFSNKQYVSPDSIQLFTGVLNTGFAYRF